MTLIRIVDHTPVVKPGQKNSHNSLVNLGRIMNRRSWLSWLVSQIQKHKLYYYYGPFSRLPIEKLLMLNRQGNVLLYKGGTMKKMYYLFLGEYMSPVRLANTIIAQKKIFVKPYFPNLVYRKGSTFWLAGRNGSKTTHYATYRNTCTYILFPF